MPSVASTVTPSGITEYTCDPTNYIIRIKEIKLHKIEPISGLTLTDPGTRIYYDENYSEYDIVTPIELSRNNITKPPAEQFSYVSILIRKDITMKITAQFLDGSTYYSSSNTTSKSSRPAEYFTENINDFGSGSYNGIYNSSSKPIKLILLKEDGTVASSSVEVSDVLIRFENTSPFLIADKLRINFNVTGRTIIKSTSWANWINTSLNNARPTFSSLPFELSVSV